MAETDEQVYRVTEAFSFDAEGRPWVMRKGDLIDTKHPAFKGHDAYLEPVEVEQVREVRRRSAVTSTETAVAEPGKPRVRTSPGKG